MDNKEIEEAENLEFRITEMKSQFQKSYDVFIKAHEDLSKISFDPSTFAASGGNLGSLAQLDTKDIDEILDAGSIDDCISTLRSKVKTDDDNIQNNFPDVTKLLSIMNGLQTDIESLTENQNRFTKLTNEVNEEMSMFEKRMEDSINQLDELIDESVNGSDSSQQDEFSDEEETLGSESLSD